jgi:hypothetical protein
MRNHNTNSYGNVRRGRVWFTTSPAELRAESRQPCPAQPYVRILRRPGQPDERRETQPQELRQAA